MYKSYDIDILKEYDLTLCLPDSSHNYQTIQNQIQE